MSWPTGWPIFLSLYKWLIYPLLAINEQMSEEKQITFFWFFRFSQWTDRSSLWYRVVGASKLATWNMPKHINFETLFLIFWWIFSWFQLNKWALSQNQRQILDQHKKLSRLMCVWSCFVYIRFSRKNSVLFPLQGSPENWISWKSYWNNQK